MTKFPPDRDREAIKEAHEEADVTVRWSVWDDGVMVEQSALKGEMQGIDYDSDEGFTIDMHLPYPVEATLTDPNKQQRVYEVMEALADGKEVEIKNGGEDA